MATRRIRAAKQIRRGTRWDRQWCLLAADLIISTGHYNPKTEIITYGSIYWLMNLTNDELEGKVPAPAWFKDQPDFWWPEEWVEAHKFLP